MEFDKLVLESTISDLRKLFTEKESFDPTMLMNEMVELVGLNLRNVEYEAEELKEAYIENLSKNTDPIELKVQIKQQGAPLINNAWVCYASSEVELVEVDLKSKWCDVSYTAGTNIGIGVTERSCHLKDKPMDETWDDDTTEISLPRYCDGTWEIWSVELSRYTLRICFKKRD